MYRDEQRAFQDRFDTRRLADRIEERLVRGELDEQATAFIARQIMFFLATVDGDGRPSCSFKGGAPGFVRVLDPRTLAFPDYDGKGMFLSMGNVAASSHVGLLFVDFQKPSRLRVNGDATIDPADPLLSEIPGAQLIVRVHVREAFPNCSRYIPKLDVAQLSPFIPAADTEPPVPDWKRSEWARDVVSTRDRAKK
jgi:hypothetical protein